MSRTPVSASCRVRGIGVAVSVSTWTSARSSFSRSLWATPKCCSSSTISRPRSLNSMLLASSAWVPITMSTVPSLTASLVALASLAATRRDRRPMRTGRPCEALAEGAVMLARQQRGRRDHRDLLARQRRHEGRAQRHLGLAEADVAADQPVHRLAGRQVVQHVGDGLQLVVGLGIGEAGAELLVERPRAGSSVSPRRMARSAAILISRSAMSAMRCFSRALRDCQATPPSRSSGDALLRRAVAAQHVDVLDRHEELVAAVVDQPAGSRAARLDLERDQAVVAADAVLAMDDQVAFAQAPRPRR